MEKHKEPTQLMVWDPKAKIHIPDQYHRLIFYNLQGEKIWSFTKDDREKMITLPQVFRNEGIAYIQYEVFSGWCTLFV